MAADSVYGVGEIEMALRHAGKGYVLGVSGAHQVNSWIGKPEVAGTAEEIAEGLDPSAWQRLSAGLGTKGERMDEGAYCELADLEAGEYDESLSGRWTRGLLIRRSLADGELAFFTTWCPAGTSIGTLVAVEGRRWAIEDAFETTKTELGLDHKATRSWYGWHRHVSFVMLAFAIMAAVRHRANQMRLPNEDEASSARALIRWSVQEIRRVAMRLAQRLIQPAHVIAWSRWRRAHQATAREAHIRRRPQL